MVESKSVKKRSVGRPKKNKALQQLRVQTWFNAVAEASGKTAYELEKEFAPSTVDRENFNKQRARLWEKYRLGKTMPTIKEKKGGRKGIAQLVEEKYPGTIHWLTDEFFDLANMEKEITMKFVREVFESLPLEIRKHIILENANSSTLFWRKQLISESAFYEGLVRNPSPYGFIALLALLREALICQNEPSFHTIKKMLIKIEDEDIKHGPIRSGIFTKIILTPILVLY
ncbi:hypothetical protein [Methylophilus sp. TWE2]|uniref:hypothetical protein n=1 Tax=Methylophilus sp. TWE2 TaxID=1662285 RepID=UPI0006714231|nr:hypothetical protein [Methylophilus sp. TWE2]AKR42209.1 hypothetical protein ACJ67_01260 [Methylophilus sp. TWE2]